MDKILKVIEKDNVVTLKDGRRTYATIERLDNPDYNWTIFFNGGLAKSGFATKELAMKKAELAFKEWQNLLNELKNTNKDSFIII